MITKLAAHAALYITALYFSLYAVTSGNAQCVENGISTNISSELVVEGYSVTLSCYVSGAGGQSTSWVSPTEEILSVDAAISVNADPRFTITANNANPECGVYNLTIANLTIADAGTYSCRPTTGMTPMSSEAVYFGYAPASTYPECRVTGGSTLVMAGEVLEFICETEPGDPVWDLAWESSHYGTIATAPTTSNTTTSELKSITSSLNTTIDENGKIMTCITSCPDPECIDNFERNCSLGQIVVVENPVDEYFFITDPLVSVTMGANASIECQTTLPGTKLQWFLHETVTENYVTETTPTGQSATIYITDVSNSTVVNPFVCSLSINGAIIATRKALLTFDPPLTTEMPTTGMQTTMSGGPTAAVNATELPPMNVTATPSMLVNITSHVPLNATSQPGNATSQPGNATSQPGNATMTPPSTDVTATQAVGNTTSGTTAGPTMNATAAATTAQQVTTSQAPLLRTNTTQPTNTTQRTNTTQQPQNTTLPSTTMQEGANTTSGSDNTTGTMEPFNPTIVQRTISTVQWWQPQTTLLPQQTMFPQQPTNVQPREPSTSAPTTPVASAASGPTSSFAAFFTLPVIMGIAAVGGLLLIFIVTAIVCVLTSRKRRGGGHDVEELTELSKRTSKPIRLDPFEVPANRTTSSDPTFAAFGKGTSTQDLINIGDENPSNAQQNGSNNVGRGNKNNGNSDTRPLTANDLLSNGIDNHGMSDSIL